MGNIFRSGGHWFRRIRHSRIPIVLGSVALATIPVLAWAKGPIVRAAADWWTVIWTILINNT